MRDRWTLFRSEERAGYSCALLCSICSACMITLVKWVQHSLPPLSVLLLSQIISGAVLTGVFLFSSGRGRLSRVRLKDWIRLSGLSLLYFFAYWTLFAALERLDPTVSSFLGRSEVLVTILFAMIFLKERFTRIEVAGGALVMAGVVVIRYAGGVEISEGFILCMGAAVLWGITEGLAKVVVQSVEPVLFTWARSLMLIPLCAFSCALSTEGLLLPPDPGIWAGVIGLALVGPVLGRLLYMKSLRLIPVSKAALICQIQPVWVALFAGIMLGTLPSPKEWLGGALIIAGCVLLVRRFR